MFVASENGISTCNWELLEGRVQFQGKDVLSVIKW